MNVEEIAWIDVLYRTYWINENCSADLTAEAHMMLAAAEHCIQTFDWKLIQDDVDFGCELLDKTIWHRAIYMVLGMSFGWDRGISWLEKFRRQLQWEEPWTTTWYDASRPLAETVDRRLLWTWLMQRELIENWPDAFDNEETIRHELEVYLGLHREEHVPPAYLDCIIEIRMQNDLTNQPVPLRLTYRKRTPEETGTTRAGVTFQWS